MNMAVRFESTVADLPKQIARLAASGTRHVLVTVLDEEESAKRAELKRLIAEGDASDLVDDNTAFAELYARLGRKYPHAS